MTAPSTPFPTSFGEGQHLVGIDIAPGRYYAIASGTFCFWTRRSGVDGTSDEILGSHIASTESKQLIVDILASDKAFFTASDCGTWFKDSPRLGTQTNLTSGVWLVGAQAKPGTYRATAQQGCYWARLYDFTGDFSNNSIISSHFTFSGTGGTELVTIEAGDVGFQTNAQSGAWTRLSSTNS